MPRLQRDGGPAVTTRTCRPCDGSGVAPVDTWATTQAGTPCKRCNGTGQLNDNPWEHPDVQPHRAALLRALALEITAAYFTPAQVAGAQAASLWVYDKSKQAQP